MKIDDVVVDVGKDIVGWVKCFGELGFVLDWGKFIGVGEVFEFDWGIDCLEIGVIVFDFVCYFGFVE